MSKLGMVAAAVGLIAVGFWLAPHPPAAPHPSAERASSPMHGAAPSALDVGALRAEIRAAVHAELAGLQPAVDGEEPGAPVADSVVEPVAEPSAAQEAAGDRARSYVDEVIARGRLTSTDTDTLRPMLAAMDFDDAMEVRRSIARAINAQSLAVDGPPMLP